MTRQKINELLQTASETLEGVFAKTGQILPTLCVVRADDTTEIVPAPSLGNKNNDAALMRAYFALNEIKCYVLIDESWRLDLTGASQEEVAAATAFCKKHGVRAHPRRVEAVMFSAEDEFGHINGWRIIERKGRKARLGPLVLDPVGGTYEGRFVCLLPRRGRTQ